MHKWMATLVLGAVLIGTTSAHANPKTHDGFYMQLAAGLGGFRSKAEVLGVESTTGGLTLPTQIFLGGTIAQHLVLSGGLFFDTSPAPKAKIDGTEVEGLEFKQFLLGIGMMADYYVWSDKGLHFPVFIGWGGLETKNDAGDAGGSDPVGLTMFFGAGYDFFIADEWSLGGLFRMVIAPLKMNDVKYMTIEPGILATFTFN